ncbi:hypothetical protein DRP53_06075 [candidate division WOR-3 bacterium]|uniref:Glycosyltransferase RgtA/B/C/D-like domain-containing protein n=1 Tax=candidate division WOR-3 bacterium TaxID=2052148 RepID=A0A660SJA7_UNCW3|nr:MAG: hypothetical protein DRP53_06075 [candidate division WOR-3 bacterium]
MKGLVVLMFLLVVSIKIFLVVTHASLSEETALFWTESALQYRNAKLVAEYGGLPVVDLKAQYPEGLKIRERLTPLMELASGLLYRYLIPRAVPFHLYIIVFISLFSSLGVIPIFLILKTILKDPIKAMVGSLLYAVTPALYTTVTAPGFELQDFALPLIFFHLYFFLEGIERKDDYKFLISGAFLFAALAAWHMTQFYYLLFILYFTLCFLTKKEFPFRSVCFIAGFAFLSGIILPPQRSARFLFSLPMLITYSLLISILLKRRLIFFLLVIFAFLLTRYMVISLVPEYRFVYGLIIDKIRNFGCRPSDPTGYSWETLVMWVSPFIGPDLGTVVRSLGMLLPLGLLGIFWGIKSRGSVTLISFLTGIFLPLYLLFIRLDAFLVWFLAVSLGDLLKKKAGTYLVGLAIVINAFLIFQQPVRVISPPRNYLLDLIRFLRYNTNRNDAILSSFPLGPSILAYADRPILLHPKFEAEGVTEKIKEFEHLIYQDEESFYRFCLRYRARWFIYQVDMLLSRNQESMRFRTHNLNLNRQSLCFQFHFSPNTLNHFELVYTNPNYRIFKVLKPGEKPKVRKKVYFRIYDPDRVHPVDIGVYD